MTSLSRRRFMMLLGVGAASAAAGWRPVQAAGAFRIRTITAGIELSGPGDIVSMQAARDFLALARSRFSERYEVQTTRIATQPLARYLPAWMSPSGLGAIRDLDHFAAEANTILSVGPLLMDDREAPGFEDAVAELIAGTARTSCSAFIASPEGGVYRHGIRAAAGAVVAIARHSPGGEGNFRFCATAFCPPGTPFFPAAWHEGAPAFSIGLESPPLLLSALAAATGHADAGGAMRAALNTALAPIAALAGDIAAETGWRYLGADTSPAPGLDASIGQVIETLSGAPFGSPSTLSACATITQALQGLDVQTCGYSGLMLPVLEDRILAQRATEGRYGMADLLLYSSVCGTGLDVVPLPGDVPESTLAAVMEDVAALAARYRKPLSARLLPIPGKRAGEEVDFDNPYLTRCIVMPPH